MKTAVSQVQNLEQTQELRIPEGMPGVGRILGVWGQILMRGKEWRRDSIQFSGGVHVWLLYEAEDGTTLQRLETWIPFQMDWDLPENTPEGKFRIHPLLRFLDARIISAGKILFRVGIACLAEVWVPDILIAVQPKLQDETIQLLKTSWLLRVPREAGEKVFQMEEDLTLPLAAPQPEAVLCYRMEPVVEDRKVLGNRLVFRGKGNLYLLYQCEDGQIHNWDFELPFSQFADLEAHYSQDAQSDVMTVPTKLEVELDEEGKLHLRAGLTAQYRLDDREKLELVEDAYDPRRNLTVDRQQLSLPVRLESRQELFSFEPTLPLQADVIADVQYLFDFPSQKRKGNVVTMAHSGMLRILGYDGDGKLQTTEQKLSGEVQMPADENAQLTPVPFQIPQLRLLPGTDSVSVKIEQPIAVDTWAMQQLPMITALEAGEKRERDPGRPSLILCRCSQQRLWDIAKENGSTMEAIREATGFAGEPEPGRMLLIPVI